MLVGRRYIIMKCFQSSLSKLPLLASHAACYFYDVFAILSLHFFRILFVFLAVFPSRLRSRGGIPFSRRPTTLSYKAVFAELTASIIYRSCSLSSDLILTPIISRSLVFWKYLRKMPVERCTANRAERCNCFKNRLYVITSFNP